MKILIFYDIKYPEFKNNVQLLKKEFELDNVKEKISVYTKYLKTQKYDIVAIYTNDINYLEKCKNYIDNGNKLVIITENLASSYIINCIKISQNICYSKNDASFLVKKIYSVYMKNKID